MDLFIVNAFTHGPFSGNPAAVVPLNQWLPDAQMQAMAAQHNLSETAFIVPVEGDIDYEIRWFTPHVEVPLCGHATLASAHVIFSSLNFDKTALRLQTRQSGVLTLKKIEDGRYAMQLPAKSQTATRNDPELAKALGLTVLEIYQGDFLTLVLPDTQAVASYQPDFAAIAATGQEIIITAKGSGAFDAYDFVSRMFAPTIGINEDPVTGAAHAQLIPYWTLVLQKADLKATQIGPRSGSLEGSLVGEFVELRGRAETYATGQIFL